jgi:hypothetical protein
MNRFVACSLLLVVAAPAAAQTNIPESAYRRGQAEVLKPEPNPNDGPAFDAASFRAAYARAKQPSVAVLWNREFSDMLEQGSASTLTINQAHAGVATREVAAVPGYAVGQATGVSAGRTTIDVQERRTQQARRSGPGEASDLQLRASFMQTLSRAGLRLVDRNMVMRTTAAARRDADKEGKLDSQQIETAALSKHATLLMEVLNTRDAASPTGWSTFVSIKRFDDGTLITEGYYNGRPADGAPRPTPRFEADPRGGFREVAPKVADVGRLVAEQMLARLGEALAR